MKAFLAGAVMMGLSGAASAQQILRIGTEVSYPPFAFLDPQGDIAGFERDLAEALCARVAVSCRFAVTDWERLIPDLLAGRHDAILAGMNITPEREALIDFTQPYLPPPLAVYVARSPDADIRTGVIAAQAGTIHAAHVAESGARLLEVATPAATLAAIRRGEADAAIGPLAYLGPTVAASGGDLVLIGDPFPLNGGVGMGFRPEDDALRARFDAAIGAMKADGSLNALITEWFGRDAATF